MRRVVVDSDAIDPLVDRPGAYEVMRAAVDQGELEVLFPHVTLEQIAAIPDKDKDRRFRLLLALVSLGRLTPTGAFVLGSSRLGFARFGADKESFEVFRSRNATKHTDDALIAATAQHGQCTLVTNDKRLASRARERGLEVFTTDKLLAELDFNSTD